MLSILHFLFFFTKGSSANFCFGGLNGLPLSAKRGRVSRFPPPIWKELLQPNAVFAHASRTYLSPQLGWAQQIPIFPTQIAHNLGGEGDGS